jgi:rhodanese-related sulfurtransferase
MEIISPIPSHGRRIPNARLALLMTGLIVATVGLLFMRSVHWFLLKKSLEHRFPEVAWISTEELANWLADKGRAAPILLDVRTPQEWNVSHLPGARHADPKVSIENVTVGISKETPIVTYCAVGYRSAETAKRLRAAGFTKVHNLEGSIFEWANERRPLVRDEQPVTVVHPYNALWGRLLTDEVRAPLAR